MGTPTRLFDRVVLVVDDEEALRHLMARALTAAGFRVLEAHDGEEAQALLGTVGPQIGLVVSDIAMPHMTGLELAAVIAKRWPTLPILLVSGEGSPPESYRGGFLAKPFLPDTLVEAVTGLLPSSQSIRAS
jgi:DNA-binding response OmpR family regulator